MIAIIAILSEIIQEGFIVAILSIAGITVFFLLCVIGNYFTKGYYVGENSLKLVNGHFGKQILIVKYSKIQYVETEQSFLAKHFHIQKGTIHLLAAMTNSVHTIPYFPEGDVEKIRERILR